MMNYKGYRGCAIYDDEAHIFHGELAGIRAVITNQGTSFAELEQSFKDSIDDYLGWCKKREKDSEKPALGKLNFDCPPNMYI